jgi:CDGSH-type Zn-finger protein
MTDPEVTIQPMENGPYLVKGPVTVLDADGSEYSIERSTIALCRCGGSTNKPFCDGTHSKIGFAAAERAVSAADADESPG